MATGDTGLLKSANVHEMIEAREQVIALYRGVVLAWAKLTEILESVGVNKSYAPTITFRGVRASHGSTDPDRGEAGFAKYVDSLLWREVLHRTQITSIMSSPQLAKLDSDSSSGKLPEFNLDNVFATITEISANRRETLLESVESIFRRLSYSYKSNLPVKFGKKFVVRLASVYRKNDLMFTMSGQINDLCDLVNMLHLLDGRPEPGLSERFRTESYQLSNRHRFLECRYFKVQVFNNGNGHVVFTPDGLRVVEKLNQLIAEKNPNTLPAGS